MVYISLNKFVIIWKDSAIELAIILTVTTLDVLSFSTSLFLVSHFALSFSSLILWRTAVRVQVSSLQLRGICRKAVCLFTTETALPLFTARYGVETHGTNQNNICNYATSTS